MLRHLTVRDFALVRAIDLELAPGLTVLTGESGAGKTILIEALGLVLGDRANAAFIRHGAERSEVVAEFDVTQSAALRRRLDELGLTDADSPGTCLVRRTVTRDGRSRAFVNGTPVNVADLVTLAALLIDIHGQNEHQQLLRRSVQLELLDSYAGTGTLASQTADAYRAWQDAAREIDDVVARVANGRDRRELLRYQVDELDELGLADGEYESLDAQFRRLAKGGETAAIVSDAVETLSGERESALASLGRIVRALDAVDDEHPRLEAARDLLRTAQAQIDEACRELTHYGDALTFEPERLSAIESRLERVLDLARKHRLRPEQLAAHVDGLRTELRSLEVDESDIDALRKTAADAQARYRTFSKSLSAKRRKAAKAFETAVGRHMRELGIKGGALALHFSAVENENGIDAVEYRVVTNPNAPPGPLAQIASGGERSRISLAIQVVAAERAKLPALILDEADVGIGGVTADVVGRLLRNLSSHTQVLCVTHAPQVAACGDHHLRVGKSAAGETFVERLDPNARVQELARMLGGREITPKTLEYAAELIEAGASGELS